MVPPQYSDLGKAAKDLFDKGFNYGFGKIDVKGQVGAAEINLKGASAFDNSYNVSSFGGSFESKFKHKQHGITLVKKVDTNNVISMEVGIEDGPLPITKGGKATLCTSFSPSSAKVMSALLKTSYKRDHLNVNLDSDFNLAGPVVNGTVVTGHEGYLVGYAFTYDSGKQSLLKSNIALGHVADDLQATVTVNDMSKFGASLFQKISGDLSLGTQIAWNKGDNQAKFGVAAKYTLDATSAAQLKVNNDGQIGCAYSKALSPGVKLTVSSLLDVKNVSAGGHKFGLGVEYQL